MADINNIYGAIPLELQPEMQDISQQQKLAQMLLQQGMQQPQGQMVSGRYVKPALTQYLQPLLGAYAGSKGMENAEQKQLELAKAIRIGREAEKQAAIPLLQKGDYTGVLALPNVYGGVTPYTEAAIKAAAPVPSAEEKGYNLAKSQGYQGTFLDYQTGLKRAGAPNVTTIMGKSIAGEVGPMMKEAQGIAQAAVKTEDSANRILQAVDSNKLFSGTAANVRLGAAQLADTLGVGGKDLQTKIGNTRQAMQGLAELTLQGRQQMRGQGAITESESKLAERAISGDITFTPTEIKQLANAAKRSADYTYKNYETKLGEMAKNPETAGLVPYYQVPRMTAPISNDLPSADAIAAEKARRGIR